jgi:hypothetical protein
MGITRNPEQLALYHFAQAEHFERLKMASANHPVLFYYYAEQQYYSRALAHRYKAMTVGTINTYTTEIEAKENQTQAVSVNRSLVDSLEEGSYILYVRHGEAVHASPFCRTRETAALALGEENVQIDPFWVGIYTLSVNLSEVEQERILISLRSVLEIKPPMGSNKVIIAHSFPKGVGLGAIPDMGTVVVKPRGQGNGYEVVAKVSLVELANFSHFLRSSCRTWVV